MQEWTTRYPVARPLAGIGLAAVALAGASVPIALKWPWVWIATGLLLATGALALVLGLIPAVEITERHLLQGRTRVPWSGIAHVEHVVRAPLVVRLTLMTKIETLVVYAGNRASRAALLQDIRRMARGAVIDGVPYREFWNEDQAPVEDRTHARSNRYPLLLSEDEAEVERLFQQLKSAGHLEPRKSPEEK